MSTKAILLLSLAFARAATAFGAAPNTLLEEKFEDSNFAARGWYDGSGPPLSSVEHLPGSTKSAEFHWRKGDTIPVNTGPFRRKFTPSDAVYVGYSVKYSSNYTGSNKPYHPHEFNMLTTSNGDYAGPAYTHLTGYIEQNEGKPVLALQDGQNIDETRIGQDLASITENRSVAGCNGNNPDGYSSVDCYLSGNVHWNGRVWKAGQVYFQDTTGPYYKGDWHHVEAYFKMNTIVAGKGMPDGQLKYWYDGVLIIEHTNVIMRTGANPAMKWNQFLIAPYIGDGSPIDQTMWVDDLRLSSSRILTDNDNDQIPDDWEIAHELDPNNPADALEDADCDRFANFAEYLAGTDPHDSKSLLQIDDVSVRDGKFTIYFNTVTGKRYFLERADDLVNAVWFPVVTNVADVGGTVEITDSSDTIRDARFYRLRL